MRAVCGRTRLQNRAYKNQAPPQCDRAPILTQRAVVQRQSAGQWPKNSHSRMITGIGTPSNQSRIPRPIISSSNTSRRKRAMSPPVPAQKRSLRKGTFQDFGISAGDNPIRNSEWPSLHNAYQWPVFGIEVHGSAGGFGSPFCNSSIECRSGERTKAMLPSRGGRLMVMPAFIRRSQVA
jgi:hypothetical protein